MPASAVASGGSVTISGGTPGEQAVAARALASDRFPWALAGPVSVVITSDPALTHDAGGYSVPGTIWIGAGWLDVGNVTILQHEMGHQVDYFTLTDAQRAQLLAFLGGAVWAYDTTGQSGLAHDDFGSERFAEQLAATYGTQDSHGDSKLWTTALAMDTELVKLGVIPVPILDHRVCTTVRVVKRIHGKRRVVGERRCHTA